jgi:hypothetical protein
MNPKKLWEIRGWSTPKIGRSMVDGNYFVATDDGQVHRMRLMNGTSVWNASLPGPATLPFWFGNNVLTTADTLYALRMADGTINFSHPKPPERPSQIYVRNLHAWYTRGDRVVDFFVENGTIEWVSQPIAAGISGPSAGDCCATAMQVYKGNRIYTVYFANGSLQYTHDMPGIIYQGRIPVLNTYIYAGDSTGTFRAVQDITGDVGWETNLGHPVAIAPGVDRNDMVGATADSNVYSVSVLDGSVNWVAPLPAEARSQPEIIYGHAFFGAEDGKVYGVSLGERKANISMEFGAPVRGRLVAFYGVLVVAGTDRIAAYDLYPPEMQFTSHSNGSYAASRQVEFRGYGIEDHFLGVQLSTDGKKWLQVGPQGISYEDLGDVYRVNWNMTLDLQPGWNTVHARLAGMVGFEPVYFPTSIQVFVDDVPPKVEITEPPSGTATNNTWVAMAGTASDDNELQWVQVSSDNSTWIPAQGTENWTQTLPLVAGTYDLYARAEDRAGNWATDSVEFTVVSGKADKEPPVVWIESPADGSHISVDRTELKGRATDNVDVRVVDWRAQGGTWSRCAGTKTWSCHATLVEGPNHFEVRASDTFRNSAIVSVMVVVDWRPPTIKVLSPPPDSFTNSDRHPAKVHVTDDGGAVTVKAFGGGGISERFAPQGGEVEIPLMLAEGRNVVDIWAEDLALNRATTMLNITLDRTPPTLKVDLWQPTTEGIKIFGSADDEHGIQTVEARGDGGPWVTASGANAWFVTVRGDPARVEVRATDLAGNSANAEVVLRFESPGGMAVAAAGVGGAMVGVMLSLLVRKQRSAARRRPRETKGSTATKP